MSKKIKGTLTFNLLAPKVPTFTVREPVMGGGPGDLFTDIVVDSRTLVLGVLLCLVGAGFGLYRLLPVKNELDAVIAARPSVSTVSPESSLEELNGVDIQYKEKLNTLDTLVKKQLLLTEPLDCIPRVIPEGMWLTSFKFQKTKERTELILQGVAYQADSAKELELINLFLNNLRQNSSFSKWFNEANIISVDQQKTADLTMTGFIISCRESK